MCFYCMDVSTKSLMLSSFKIKGLGVGRGVGWIENKEVHLLTLDTIQLILTKAQLF